VTGRTSARDLLWLDALKGVAMLWILLNHVVEQIAGGEYVGNPEPGWPPLGVRVAQFFAPVGPGFANALLGIVRDVGWLGDQGVTLFLIASGFGIAYGLSLRTTGRIDLVPFFRARAARVYPLWLGAHAVLLVALFATWSKIGVGFVASAIGIRFLPQTMYAFVPAWWYVGLLLQLYAVVPLLWDALRRFGAPRVLVAACAIGFVCRLVGLLSFHAYLDPWSRGAIFVTRLPEFAFGMCLGTWYAADPVATARLLRRASVRLAALALALAGFGAAFTLAGMAVAPFAMGVGVFVLLVPVVARSRPRALVWIGRHSYAIYLVHQPLVAALVPSASAAGGGPIAIRTSLALVDTVAAARMLEVVVDVVGRALRGIATRGPAVALSACVAFLAAGYGALLAADFAAQRFAPLEIDGWGERPSLEPDAAVGWKLIPSKTTRLRWTSYDYVVHSNALGFPMPESARPASGALRVFVTGDAFTSGEGVGTDGAWPTLLATELARGEHRPVAVANFAITGYGPDQEARVVRIEVPRERPNVVVFESFVNAFEKLSLTDDDLRRSIGFGNPPADGRAATLKLLHLRAYLSETVVDRARERLGDTPDSEDVGLADGSAFLRDDPAFPSEATAYRARVRAARDVARAAGAAFLLVMIPSRSQACAARDFRAGAYLDLAREPTYDADRPQRTAAATARALGVPFLDLRAALRADGTCRYQRENMHFIASGDVATARAVARAIDALGRAR
jgi:peptidoglycan/LPS O-acetylase OafA/YrhL